MSAFDNYLQLLNNNPKMDATKNALNKWLDTTKNTISNSLPPTNGDSSALIDWAAKNACIPRSVGSYISELSQKWAW